MQTSHAFSEKVALVAGCAEPIGRAVLLQLALLGAFVVSVDDVEATQSDASLDELRSLGTLAAAVKADISTREGAAFAVAEIDKMFGRIDLLVTCLKIDAESEFPETDDALLERLLSISLKSPYFLIQEAIRLMAPRPKARIVIVVGPHGGSSAPVFYEMSRSAVEGLTAGLARVLPRHFRVNSVAVEGVRESRPTGLYDEPTGIANDDIARTVLFLLSSEASGINGTTIPVG